MPDILNRPKQDPTATTEKAEKAESATHASGADGADVHEVSDTADLALAAADDSLAEAPQDKSVKKRSKKSKKSKIGQQRTENAGPSLPRKRRRYFLSPLVTRIMAVNMVALLSFVGGIFYLNDFRDTMIDNRTSDLTLEAQIIAGALGESAVSGDATEYLDLATARQIITRLVGPTENRVRLFDAGGGLVVDSQFLDMQQRIYEEDLSLDGEDETLNDWFEKWVHWILDAFAERRPVQPYVERPGLRAGDLLEVESALLGETASLVRRRIDGTDLVNVAVPVQRFRRIVGVMLLTADTDDIAAIVRAEEISIVRVFLTTLGITVLLSFFLARTVVNPIRRLAAAAEKVRFGMGRQEHMPSLENRHDEIGDLSEALSEMTRALYNQIDAVERFAADVAHELKNPLTSMRSALETLESVDNPDIQAKLHAILRDDVRRLDRLISDISEASRLDAELTRGRKQPIDIGAHLTLVADSYADGPLPDGMTIKTVGVDASVFVHGSDDRLGQVWRNLIDNAISFSPDDGTIFVTVKATDYHVTVSVADNGPGVADGASDKIFKRFYSERNTGESFGKHSGLGLAICKQIIEAHGGRITVRSQSGRGQKEPSGAIFDILLPRGSRPRTPETEKSSP